MKRFNHIHVLLIIVITVSVLSSCNGKREPGRSYMPDMAYSRAVETYSLLDDTIYTSDPSKAGRLIFYNRKPVEGTVEHFRNFEMYASNTAGYDSNGYKTYAAYMLSNDSNGYKMSAAVKNPLHGLNTADSAEASRLFNINCAICHGADGKADGPLATSGKIGGVANLTTDAYIKMADGTMYHSIYYGKGNMGSYASQLDRKQRWMMVQYIRALQPKPAAAQAGATVAATTDSAAAKKGTL